jgi:hypothetical protein
MSKKLPPPSKTSIVPGPGGRFMLGATAFTGPIGTRKTNMMLIEIIRTLSLESISISSILFFLVDLM